MKIVLITDITCFKSLQIIIFRVTLCVDLNRTAPSPLWVVSPHGNMFGQTRSFHETPLLAGWQNQGLKERRYWNKIIGSFAGTGSPGA